MRLQNLRTWRHVPTAVVRCVVTHALRCQRYLSWHPTKLVVYAQATNAGDLMYIDRSTKQRVACHRGLRYEWDSGLFQYQQVILHTQPDGAVEAVAVRLYAVEVFSVFSQLPSVKAMSAPLWTWNPLRFRISCVCLYQRGRLLIIGYGLADSYLTSRLYILNLLTCEVEHSLCVPWPRVVVVRPSQQERVALLLVAGDNQDVHYMTVDTVTGTIVNYSQRLNVALDSMWDVMQVGPNVVALVDYEKISLVRWSDSRVLDMLEFEPLNIGYDTLCWLANSRELVLQHNGYFGVMVASP